MNQRRSGNSEKNPEKPEELGSRQGKEQNIYRMQSHFFTEHARHQNIQLNLVNQHDHPKREPEFCRTHAQRDQQDGNRNQERADIWQKLAEKREHAKDERRLHAD